MNNKELSKNTRMIYKTKGQFEKKTFIKSKFNFK